jgi:hypothetical protein
MVSVGWVGELLRGMVRVWRGLRGQAETRPAFPSYPRSRVQPDFAPRFYCHRHSGAAAWNLLPGVCVGTSRERRRPSCGHRG